MDREKDWAGGTGVELRPLWKSGLSTLTLGRWFQLQPALAFSEVVDDPPDVWGSVIDLISVQTESIWV